MNLLKKLPLFLLPLLLLTACRKNKLETTGTLKIDFQNGIPSCYSIYTEASYYSSIRTPLYQAGYRPAAIEVVFDGNTVTFKGLNYGNYVLSACSYGTLAVQVVAGGTRTYKF
ncbi:hypothetical protein FAM09_07570 [Niastella caeni]|uniref:Lipoprotein n=1 Tax=Niastella caeni TaxID=2569763 RepID=A0A4S8I2B6_9BACT|nr:hypothetical protein [Niastella caeni]THU41951.1 hypothetical protein FAM09_07570 [Niastella caeni]